MNWYIWVLIAVVVNPALGIRLHHARHSQIFPYSLHVKPAESCG
ncbi:MAG: hypothetical protein ACR2GX_04610 [Candidatus Dormibacteria bacterium]